MNSSNIPQITADEVYKAINEKKDVVILDVRTAGEFVRGHIEGSLNIPVDDIPSQVTAAITDKNKIIYVYCFSASRSDVAADIMTQLGYTNVFSMTSGILMWKSKQYPLVH